MSVNQENANLLALYGISLINEVKSSATIKLKNCNTESKLSRVLYEKLLSALRDSSVHYIKLPQICFGVELEFVGSRLHNDITSFNKAMFKLVGGDYFQADTYIHNDGTSWILGKDGSIGFYDTNLPVPFGYELSSPTLDLFNNDHTKLLSDVIDLIKTYLHGEINFTCGTHIHIGFKRDNTSRISISNLLSSYSYMESKVFDPIVPKSRRRNKYCKKTQPWLRNKYQKLSSRYCVFNYDGECKNLHFEFRQLEGTLDLNTILYWATLQTYILYDLLDHINDDNYRASLVIMNIFDILFRYDFDSDLINFFLNRVIEFKSRTIQL